METCKIIPVHCDSGRYFFYKCILTFLHYNKHNKVNLFVQNMEKYFPIENNMNSFKDSFTDSHKTILAHHVLLVEMTGSTFLISIVKFNFLMY